MSTENQALTVRNPKELLAYLEKGKSAISMALPKHLNADRMCRLALTCFSTNPALRQCTPQSILGSLVVASQLGLEPGIAGQGYLIPYKNTCTFVPGWQGLVALLNNTGRATAWTGSVFEGDNFVFSLGSNPRCDHVPGPNYGDPEKLTWVYACGKVNGSEQPVIEAWPMSRVIKHRDRYNKVGARHYSFQHEEMYARKVVLLQVLKYMPRSIELNNAITVADAAELGHGTRVDAGVIVIDPEPGDIAQEKPKFETPAALPPGNVGPTPAPKPKPAPPVQQAPKPAPAPVQDNPPLHPNDPIHGEQSNEAAESEAGLAPAQEQEAEAPPEEAPPAPAPPPTPPPAARKAVVPKKPAAAPAPPPVQLTPRQMLENAQVTCDDFTDWLVTTGRNKDAKAWATYDDVTPAFWTALTRDVVGIGKCVRLYSPQEQTA